MKLFASILLALFVSIPLHGVTADAVCYRLLGEKAGELEYVTDVSRLSPAWLDDHLVGRKEKALAVYPAAAYLDGILAAMMSQPDRLEHPTILVEEVTIPNALPLMAARREKPPSPATIQTTLARTAMGYTFSIASRGEHMKGVTLFGAGFAPFPALFRADGLPTEMESKTLYADLEKRGLPYGETFRLVRRVVVNGDTSKGEITPHDSLDFSQHFIHPTITDSALHTVAAILIANQPGWDIPEQFRNSIALPVGFDRVQVPTKKVHQLRGNFTTEAKITGVRSSTERDLKVTVKYDLLVRDAEGTVVLQITGGQLLFR